MTTFLYGCLFGLIAVNLAIVALALFKMNEERRFFRGYRPKDEPGENPYGDGDMGAWTGGRYLDEPEADGFADPEADMRAEHAEQEG